MSALSPRNTPPEATRKHGQPVNLPGLALAGGALLGGGALAVSLRRRALRGGLAHATGTIDALRKDMAEVPPSIREPLKNFMNGPTPVITHAASPTPEDWRAMQAHFSDISSRKAALQAGAYSRYPELESDLTSRLREGSIHDKFQEAFHHKDSVPNSLRHKYDQYLLATAKSSSADLGEILAADSLPFHPSTGSLNPTYTGIFKQSSLSLARQFLTKSAEDSRPQVKYVYPGDTNKVSGAIWGGMLGSWLGGGASPAWAAAGSLGGAAAGVGLQVYRDHRIDQGIREGWLQPSEVHRPTMLGRSTTGALAGGITGAGLSMIPGVRLKYAVPAAAALGAVLGASGTPRAQARFDRMPLISKQASQATSERPSVMAPVLPGLVGSSLVGYGLGQWMNTRLAEGGMRLDHAGKAGAILMSPVGAGIGLAYGIGRMRGYSMGKQASTDFQPVNPAHRGDLHAAMGVPQGERISEESLRHVLATTENAHLRHMAQFALNARKWHHV